MDKYSGWIITRLGCQTGAEASELLVRKQLFVVD